MKIPEDLLEFNRRGLIQAPDESDAVFFTRCQRAQPIQGGHVSSLAFQLFDINPDWVVIQESQKGLHLWEGGCTWIEEGHATIQLRPVFQKKGNYLGYHLNEVVAHELVHVARGSFEEPIFEEILAYRTSASLFRRYWAPILRTSRESLFSVLALSACAGAAFFEPLHMAALATMVCLVGGGMIRLVRTQRIFNRALKRISTLVGQEKSLAVMLRLTDREIIRFSNMNEADILAYIEKMSKKYIRWQQITCAYF